MNIFFYFFLLTAAILSAETDHFYVRLANESKTLPLYLSQIPSTGSGFDEKYVGELQEILRFDLNYNGMTEVKKTTSEKSALIAKAPLDSQALYQLFKSENIFFSVIPKIIDKKLSIELLIVSNSSLKHLNGIILTGNLNRDRSLIHELSDAIFKTLFDKKGIATTHILYTVKKLLSPGKWIAEVWEADYDGGNARQITNENTLIVSPTYLPPKPGFKSGSFFYVSYKTGQPKIYVSSLKGGDSQRITSLSGNQLMPAVSYERDHLSFISDASGNPDLFLLSFDPEKGLAGKPRQIFATSNHSTQGSPSFSPDGKKIAFVSNKDGAPRIYTMRIPLEKETLKEIKPELLTKLHGECTSPSFSPDGNKIAYSALTQGVRQIWVYDFVTKQEKQITTGALHKENPSWAPDSLHLVFNSSSKGEAELYLVNLNQEDSVKITRHVGESRFPSWEPVTK